MAGDEEVIGEVEVHITYKPRVERVKIYKHQQHANVDAVLKYAKDVALERAHDAWLDGEEVAIVLNVNAILK